MDLGKSGTRRSPTTGAAMAQRPKPRTLRCYSDSPRDRKITRYQWFKPLRLGFLAPDITKAIFNGTQPPTLTANKLMSDTRLPLEWPKQRNALGFA